MSAVMPAALLLLVPKQKGAEGRGIPGGFWVDSLIAGVTTPPLESDAWERTYEYHHRPPLETQPCIRRLPGTRR